MNPAHRGRRILASTIDFILVPTVAILLMLVTGVLEHADDYTGYQPLIRGFLLGLSSYLILNGWLLWQRGQTVGKAVMGIAIVSADDASKLSIWKLLLIRAWFFPLLYIGFLGWFVLLPLLDLIWILKKDRRCLHDYLCGSAVVAYSRN